MFGRQWIIDENNTGGGGDMICGGWGEDRKGEMV